MKEVIGDCQLYRGDCKDIIPLLDKVDALLLDPPYILSDSSPGKYHYGMSLGKFESKEYTDIVNGFDMDIFTALERICDPFNMFCFCSNKQISKLMGLNEQKERITTLLVWHKLNAAPFANGVWRGDIEYIVHARDKGATFIGNAEEKKKVSEFPIVQDKDHPTVKPLGLIKKFVKICTTEGQNVLDPYVGSGTTLVACAQMNRKAIGIEINQKYFDEACRRVENAYKQPDMLYQSMKQEVMI